MVEFLEFMSCVQYRVPILEGGRLGEPQITKKWTSPIKGAQHKKAKKETMRVVTTPTETTYFE